MTRTSQTAAAGLEALVDDYIQSLRRERERELSHFRSARTDEDAISGAALARLPNGNKHPHQYRNPPASLKESRRLLLDNLSQVRRATSFQELIELVDHLIRPLDRMGEMVVYDTALRIGARFGLEPEKVYVHRGTRDGIRKLGLDVRRETIELDELPEPIRKLTPREAEDFLCVYKDSLSPRREARAGASCLSKAGSSSSVAGGSRSRRCD
jgi:hypothetical protein